MSIVNFLAALALTYVLWSLSVKRGMRNLTCQRHFSQPAVFEGQSGELVETVRNDGPFIIPWLRVESYISADLQFGKQENLDICSDTYHRSCFTLMPYQQIRRRHHVKFLRRGAYDLGNASLAAGDPLGLTRFFKDQQLHTSVVVYPRILEDKELPHPVSRMVGELLSKNKLLTDPFLVRGIRPYMPGDLIRDIHWQATARTDELQVRVHDSTVCTRLFVVLNAQQFDNQWDDYIPDNAKAHMEDAIRLAATVCVHGLRAGLAVGFAANMPQKTLGKSTVIAPGEGTAWEETLLDSFAHLQLHCSEKFIPLLEELYSYTDTDILILSPYDSDSIQEAIRKLHANGNQVTFYQTEGGHL